LPIARPIFDLAEYVTGDVLYMQCPRHKESVRQHRPRK
jgi:hypothetical protein